MVINGSFCVAEGCYVIFNKIKNNKKKQYVVGLMVIAQSEIFLITK